MSEEMTRQIVRILEIVFKKDLNKEYIEDLKVVLNRMVGEE